VVVRNGGRISVGGTAAVSVTGLGSATAGGNFNFGVWVTDAGASITSGGGTVTVTGTGGANGGASRGNFGVEVESGGQITSGGAGTVTVQGDGGNRTGTGDSNYGVILSGSGSRITSGGGAVVVTGVGGGGVASVNNVGTLVFFGGEITAGGSGAVSVTGTAGSGTADNSGVRVESAGSRITSGGGTVTVTGTGGTATNSAGVSVVSDGVIGGGNAFVVVTADSMNFTSPVSVNAGTGSVLLRPRTAGTRVDLGGADVLTGSPLTLGLTDAELDRVTAGSLEIGGGNSPLTVSAAITRPAATNLSLVSGVNSLPAVGADMVVNAPVNTAGGTVQFIPGYTVSFPNAGTDVTAGGVSFPPARRLVLVNITGPAADTQYPRLVVRGAVDLSFTQLTLSGGYVPRPGDSFTVVSATAVTGTLVGLPNGGAVVFNGVTLRAVYTATSVVLVPNLPPVITSVSVPPTTLAGLPVFVTATATDPEGDRLTFAWVVSLNGVPLTGGVGQGFTFTPTAGGGYTVALTVTDGFVGGTATATRTLIVPPPPVVTPPPPVTLPPARVVTTVGGVVRVHNPFDGGTAEFAPFPGFGGEVRVATADLNGDGLLDFVAAAGPGGSPHVKVIDGRTLGEIASFFAYYPAFAGGVYVAAANGRIVVGAGATGGPHVKAIDARFLHLTSADGQIDDAALAGNFYAFAPSFSGGVRVAAADLNADGVADVVVGTGPGGGSQVKAIDGTRLGEQSANGQIADAALLANFFAFPPTFAGGVFVAATGGRIAVGADGGGGPHVKLFDRAGNPAGEFFAFHDGFSGGVRVGFADADGDGTPDLLTAAGPGGGPHVKAFRLAPFAEVRSFYADDPFAARGVFVN
jgi:fibronectin-binding autotransporter adhesin